jgi:hypothetical protein
MASIIPEILDVSVALNSEPSPELPENKNPNDWRNNSENKQVCHWLDWKDVLEPGKLGNCAIKPDIPRNACCMEQWVYCGQKPEGFWQKLDGVIEAREENNRKAEVIEKRLEVLVEEVSTSCNQAHAQRNQ